MIEKYEIIDPKVRWYGRECYQLDFFQTKKPANDNSIVKSIQNAANDNVKAKDDDNPLKSDL